MGILNRVRFQWLDFSTGARPFMAVPNSDNGTRIAPEICKTMIELRLGIPIFKGTDPCPSCTSSQQRETEHHLPLRTRPIPALDAYGHHATVCSCDDGSTRRHDLLQNRHLSFLSPYPNTVNAMSALRVPQDRGKPQAEQRKIDVYVDDCR